MGALTSLLCSWQASEKRGPCLLVSSSNGCIRRFILKLGKHLQLLLLSHITNYGYEWLQSPSGKHSTMQWLLHPLENSIFGSALKAPGFGPGDIYWAPTIYQTLGSHEELNTCAYSNWKRAGMGAKWQVWGAQVVGWGGEWGTGALQARGCGWTRAQGTWRSDLCPKRTQSLCKQKGQDHTTQDGRAVLETRRPSSPLRATHIMRWLPQPFLYILANNNSNNNNSNNS